MKPVNLFYMDVVFIHIPTTVCLTVDYAWFVFFCLVCFVPCFLDLHRLR